MSYGQDGSARRWDAEKCTEALLAFYDRYSRWPAAVDLRAHNGMPAHSTVKRWFGSTDAAIRQAEWRMRKRAAARSALTFAEQQGTSTIREGWDDDEENPS